MFITVVIEISVSCSYIKISLNPIFVILIPNIMKSYYYVFAGAGIDSREKLEFKSRLTIALEAAKGDPLQNQ